MTIGVLAVQGAFIEHIKIIEQLGAKTVEIRELKDLEENKLEGLILPGGESTTMIKLIKELNLFDKLKKTIDEGIPVFGTCAGMILMAKEVSNDNTKCFEAMDIKVKRNAYGRQLGSFQIEQEMKLAGMVKMTFIRAPYIEKVDENVEILACVDGNIVAAKQDNMLVTAFHPELTENLNVHKLFLDMVKEAKEKMGNFA